ncbi:MAG: DUF2345 domain-containing protein, partial [Enterobacterales bacterium]|nr:DUF2345 domain-containing protein [Enterobacterales bacterium]
IAIVTPRSAQVSAADNVVVTAQENVGISAIQSLSMSVGKMISLFAHKLGIKIIAAEGKVQVQAQNGEMEMTSTNNLQITSTQGKVVINAQQELLLTCGGAGIRIKDGVIEEIAPNKILQKSPILSYMGGDSVKATMPSFPKGEFVRQVRLHVAGNPQQALGNRKFRLTFPDGSMQEGITDANGQSELLQMSALDNVQIAVLPEQHND